MTGMLRGRLRSLAAGGVAVGLTAGALTAGGFAAPAAWAGHGHGPSAREVAAGKAAVARRERQVSTAAAQVQRSQDQLAQLGAAAEVAIEAYNQAKIEQGNAQRDVHVAQLVLSAADQRVTKARDRVGRFAAAAYISGGFSTVNAMLGSDGPEQLLYRVGTLDAISRSQRDATQALDAARVFELSVKQEAQATFARARAAARKADDARGRAQAAVDRQSSQVSALQERRRHLRVLLGDARRHASALERARLEALARARARAAARAAAAAAAAAQQAASASGATGDVVGTVSAATEQQAVTYAESQIGKPYEWGAVGPDSYDCSGLVMWAYGNAGVTLDHWTGYQWREGARVSTSALRPGDLVFFATDTSNPDTIHHVGIYIGNGQMVEAPYTGANVRISSAWRPDLIGAVRPYDN
ncbi:MAG: peptidoglycan DL-endopeptidase RipA [Frankiaceae bacterium]|jgi:cell wall-associated NlpC family hydrolase|nr:peptidoglycan DL-endopeptidase RipA [Frankiaceae bacterium]